MRLIICNVAALLYFVADSVGAQRYTVTDSFCPPIQAASNSYFIDVVMSPTANSIPCELQLPTPDTYSSAQVRIVNMNCYKSLYRAISIRGKWDNWDFFCSRADLLSKIYQVSSTEKLTIKFPASSYNYKLQLSIVVVFFRRSSSCSLSEFSCHGSSSSVCVTSSKVCDGVLDCSGGQDEPNQCRSASSTDLTPDTPQSSNVAILEYVINWFQAKPVLRFSVAGGIALLVLLVLPTIMFCCCAKKASKSSRSNRDSGRRRARDLDDVALTHNANRRGRSAQNDRYGPTSGYSSSATQQSSTTRYDPLRTEPSAPPPPLSSVSPIQATAQPVMLLPTTSSAQPVYAVPYAQTGGQPAMLGQSVGANGDRPQFVAAYVLQPGTVAPQPGFAGTHIQVPMPLLLGAPNGQPVQSVIGPPFRAASPPVAVGHDGMARDACPPPTYDEAVRTAMPLLPSSIEQPPNHDRIAQSCSSNAGRAAHGQPDGYSVEPQKTEECHQANRPPLD